MATEQALDLSFGFNDPNFSDRTLLLEIVGDAVGNDDRLNRLRNVKLRPRDDLLTDNTTLSAVKTIHVTSLILAARSPFFRKLFSNGMRESEQKNVTLRIQAIEEVSFMDLLNYVYSNKLPTTLDALLVLCLTADKFEVHSCLRDCTLALEKLPMTCESASLYLDLPPCLLLSPALHPLIHAAKQFLVAYFRNLLSNYKEAALNLPLLGFQEVISSDTLQVSSEFEVYECVLEWVRTHYTDLEERREILKTHVLHLVRFPFMSTKELTEDILSCNDIDPEVSSKIVIRALSFKSEINTCRKRRRLAADEGGAASRQFVKRAYFYRPVELESHRQGVVYLDLMRKDLIHIRDGVWSETFYVDGIQLGLSAYRTNGAFCLDLDEPVLSACTVEFVISVRRKPREDFQIRFQGTHTFNVQGENLKLLGTEEWSRFIDINNSHFINGVLHLRAELTVSNVVDAQKKWRTLYVLVTAEILQMFF